MSAVPSLLARTWSCLVGRMLLDEMMGHVTKQWLVCHFLHCWPCWLFLLVLHDHASCAQPGEAAGTVVAGSAIIMLFKYGMWKQHDASIVAHHNQMFLWFHQLEEAMMTVWLTNCLPGPAPPAWIIASRQWTNSSHHHSHSISVRGWKCWTWPRSKAIHDAAIPGWAPATTRLGIICLVLHAASHYSNLLLPMMWLDISYHGYCLEWFWLALWCVAILLLES